MRQTGNIGEGFDDARLDTLFLALPVSWKGTLVQYTGRLHRLRPGKTEDRIYDYVDPACRCSCVCSTSASEAIERSGTHTARRLQALVRQVRTPSDPMDLSLFWQIPSTPRQ